MNEQEILPVAVDKAHIVQESWPALSEILQTKFDCIAVAHGLNDISRAREWSTSRKPVSPEKKYVKRHKNVLVSVWKDDLTTHRVDAVVNAANEGLQHFGGLALALSEAGGPQIQMKCNEIIQSKGLVKTGDCVVTQAGSLPCNYIIHAVGPHVPKNHTNKDVEKVAPLLTKAVNNILKCTEEKDLRSVAIPALSSGLFNFPLRKCAEVIVCAVERYPFARRQPVEVRLVNNDDPSVDAMLRQCTDIFGPSDPTAAVTSTKSDRRTAEVPVSSVQIGSVTLHLKKGHIEEEKMVYKLVEECLRMAADRRVSSISFPAIGTGNLGIDKGQVARAMTRAAVQFAQATQKKMDIYLVIFPRDSDTLKAFDKELHSIKLHVHNATHEYVGFGHASQPKPCIELRASCKQAVKEAQKFIYKILNPDRFNGAHVLTIKNNHIMHFGQRAHENLMSVEEIHNVKMREFFQKGQSGITIRGSADSVSIAGLEVEALCCKMQNESAQENERSMLQTLRDLGNNVTLDPPINDFKRIPEQIDSAKCICFKQSGLNIEKAERVENVALAILFDLRRRLSDGAECNTLYQRVPAQFCSLVCKVGVQRDYAPPRDQLLGEGIYFTGSVEETMKLWEDTDDEYVYILEAKVFTGKSVPGSPGLIVPPQCGPDPFVLYDSLKGGKDTHVIFNTHQALPTCLYTCKRLQGSKYESLHLR
ncbi:protein mono-ADP-ribosyltransferase PARP9 isoform X2 [Denticeps clupeoides]|uniref:protein mono-ADP-ribosyltransferase PARP9 isoform X2 n=1 Tax=Denticeps clupeoides TaxID=299321 RepID=UPI0010A31F35|nr:protein mono-ADP-ribosyltransferase PARP9 isoform X2 [Denticeps clupeoides]